MSQETDTIFALIFCIESCVVISLLFCIDLYRRISKERKRKIWEDPEKIWPRPGWWRILTTYLFFIPCIISSYLIIYNQTIVYIFSFIFSFSFPMDWITLEVETMHVRIAYDSFNLHSRFCKNWAKITCFIGSILLLFIYILFVITIITASFHFNDLSLFITIQSSISLIATVMIGGYFYYHTRIGHLQSESLLRTNKQTFDKWLERFVYLAIYLWIRIMCHIGIITVFIFNYCEIIEFENNVYCIVFGTTFQIWWMGYYYCFVGNRFNHRGICNICWNPYSQYAYQKSLDHAKSRDKNAQISEKDITNKGKDIVSEQSDDDGKDNKITSINVDASQKLS